MAKQVSRGALSDKLAGPLKAHAQDETTYRADFSEPPPGIIGGVARLNYAKLGTYASGVTKGEKFVRLAGTIVSPKTVSVVKQTFKDGRVVNLPVEVVNCEGLSTSRMLPLCDTKTADGTVTTADENIATMLNELRTLGGDECTENVDSESSLEAMLAALEKGGIHFKFGTSSSKPTKEYPTPRTWQNWRGACEYDGEPESGVTDETGTESNDVPDEEPQEGDPEEDLSALAEAADGGDEEAAAKLTEMCEGHDPVIDPNEYATWVEVVPVLQGEDAEEAEEESGEKRKKLMALAKKAEANDKKAQRAIREAGKEAGILDSALDDAESWAAAVEMILAGGEAAEVSEGEEEEEEAAEEETEEEAESEEPKDPEKGDVWLYQAKGAKKAEKCEVLAVLKKVKTATVKRNSDGKKFLNVPWAKLKEV
jgi:hypothetical protein